MLLELAIGDAYGAGFEFSPTEKIARYNDLSGYQAHELGIAPGHYTDDTQMTLALCELMLDGGQWTPENITEKFVAAFKRDPRPGYAKGLQEFLQDTKSGSDFLARIRPISTRNGAAMRAIPCGFLSSEAEVLSAARVQAAVTHNTEEGITSASAIALSAYYLRKALGPPKELPDYLEGALHRHWNTTWKDPVPCEGYATVDAVLSSLLSSFSYRNLLTRSVAYSGDVDSVAALTLGLASLSRDYINDLPGNLYDGLENGSYGRDYLTSIDRQMKELGSL